MKKIMFSDAYNLTEAVLSGRKPLTRRIINLSLENLEAGEKFTPERIFFQDGVWKFELDGKVYLLPRENLPKYKVGEVVAVAQSYAAAGFGDTAPIIGIDENDMPIFASEAGVYNKMFVRADLMPHQIRITSVRVERLNEISDDDCLREGITSWVCRNKRYYGFFDNTKGIFSRHKTPREAYAALIDRISGKGTWNSNPYVFFYDFELVK